MTAPAGPRTWTCTCGHTVTEEWAAIACRKSHDLVFRDNVRAGMGLAPLTAEEVASGQSE